MSVIHLEPLLDAVERRAVVSVLRSHPEWTLDHLATLLEDGGARAPVLGSLTIGELLDDVFTADDGGPPISPGRLAAARRARGLEFDAYLREVLAEAGGRPVGASYLRARLGGPRWKLQAALGRLVTAGLIRRSGTTSATRYWVAEVGRA